MGHNDQEHQPRQESESAEQPAKNEKSKHIRFHPLLQTLEEALEHPEEIYSHNLPIGAVVPVWKRMEITVFSWSVMNISYDTSGFGLPVDPGFPTGLLPDSSKENKLYAEITNPNSLRKLRIVNAIKEMLEDRKPDIFFLQETWKELEDALKIALQKTSWELIEDKHGMPILWNKNTLTLVDVVPYEEDLSSPGRNKGGTKKVICQIKETMQKVMFCNIYWAHSDAPLKAERLIEELVNEADAKDHLLVLGGNFKNRIIPLQKSFLINNVVLRQGKQGGDWTDGIIYHLGKDMMPQQLETYVLDPKTNEKFSQARVEHYIKYKREDFNDFQVAETTVPRPYLSFDQQSSPEVERDCPASLVHFFKDKGFRFRKAANAFGERYAAMSVSKFDPNSDKGRGISAAIELLKEAHDANIVIHEAPLNEGFFIVFNDIKLISQQQRSEAQKDQAQDIPLLTFSSLQKIERLMQVKAFEKIYEAQRVRQSLKFLRSNFLKQLVGKEYLDAYDLIVEHAKKPNSSTANAWDLAKKHYENCVPENLSLFKSVDLWSFEHCFFSRSKFPDETIYSSSKLSAKLATISDDVLKAKINEANSSSAEIAKVLRK